MLLPVLSMACLALFLLFAGGKYLTWKRGAEGIHWACVIHGVMLCGAAAEADAQI